MKVAKYIAQFLIDNGISDVFTVTGGGAMHLNDAFGHEDGLTCTYFLHEQSATIAAEGYARVDNRIPAVCVTTGPGGTNTLTGVLCAWQDSIPMLILSGQVKTSALIESTGLALRQFGEQEYNIIDSVMPMTKFAITVKDPYRIKYYLQKALHIASSGRRGPCWLDIPLDVQGADIDTDKLEEYYPEEEEYTFDKDTIKDILESSKRPVVLVGSAVRTSGAYARFRDLYLSLNIPFIMAKSVADIMADEDEYYFGNFGINGGRPGNFIIQNADCILALGCRMSFGQIGFNYHSFSPKSIKIVVDVDLEELKKKTIAIDYPIHSDLTVFIDWMKQTQFRFSIDEFWISYCNELRNLYPIFSERFMNSENINAYYFAHVMKQKLKDNSICVMGNSCSAVSIKQCGISKNGQRMWGNTNCGTMGYDIPASIGAAINAKRDIICCAGDGSFQMNIQELQTIVTYNLPVKFFVFNNGGYRSIIMSQSKNFNRLSGCTKATGLELPELERIAYAYKIPYFRIERTVDLDMEMEEIINMDGYLICEIIEDDNQEIIPKLSNCILEDGQIVSPPIDDLYPFLDRDEYAFYSDFDSYKEKQG